MVQQNGLCAVERVSINQDGGVSAGTEVVEEVLNAKVLTFIVVIADFREVFGSNLLVLFHSNKLDASLCTTHLDGLGEDGGSILKHCRICGDLYSNGIRLQYNVDIVIVDYICGMYGDNRRLSTELSLREGLYSIILFFVFASARSIILLRSKGM